MPDMLHKLNIYSLNANHPSWLQLMIEKNEGSSYLFHTDSSYTLASAYINA